jgi:bifunctional UDP-N-acetylglucosamine pyrophosphorylase/glucosamine-1-phosphate N-acetyltransferase
VGDADIGPRANIGAGNITANYDGKRKHRTTVGADARTGSNTVLVAPVTVGDGAYTGAGSVVNRDVPPGALAKGVPARIEEGWVAARDAEREDGAGDGDGEGAD